MRVLLFLSLFSLFLFAFSSQNFYNPQNCKKDFIFLGKKGKTYPIKEKDFYSFIQEETSSFLKREKIDLKKEVIKNVKKLSLYNTKFLFCEKNLSKPPKQDYFVLPVNIVNPFGRVVYKKGTKILVSLPKGRTADLCFVAGNRATVFNQIQTLKKLYPACLFLVADVSVFDVRQKFPNIAVYPSSAYYEKRFRIRCYPTVVHLKGGTIQHREYAYSAFLHQKQNRSQTGRQQQ